MKLRLLDCEVVGTLILRPLPSRFKLRMCTSAAVTSPNYKIVEMAQREPCLSGGWLRSAFCCREPSRRAAKQFSSALPRWGRAQRLMSESRRNDANPDAQTPHADIFRQTKRRAVTGSPLYTRAALMLYRSH